MHYYTYSALIFKEKKIVDGLNALYKHEESVTIIEFKQHVMHFFAGDPATYDRVVILNWEELNEERFNYIKERLGEWEW